eukprot:149680-Karenia_brevis.AAC.1
MGAASASPSTYSQPIRGTHDLTDLVDPLTIERIKDARNAEVPQVATPWYTCPHDNCSYMLFSNDGRRHQNKWQHMR